MLAAFGCAAAAKRSASVTEDTTSGRAARRSRLTLHNLVSVIRVDQLGTHNLSEYASRFSDLDADIPPILVLKIQVMNAPIPCENQFQREDRYDPIQGMNDMRRLQPVIRSRYPLSCRRAKRLARPAPNQCDSTVRRGEIWASSLSRRYLR